MELPQIRAQVRARWLMVLVAGILLPGCAPTRSNPDAFRGLDAAERYAADTPGRHIGPDDAPPPLSIGSVAVSWDELVPRLAEAAGGMVVEEIALDRKLDDEMARRGMTVTDGDIVNERAWLGVSVARGASGEALSGDELVYQIRQRRGLGPVRFASLLRRNAMLRALVRDRVAVTDAQVELAWRVQHGPKLRVRLIVTPTQREAQSVIGEALQGSGVGVEQRFAELAQQRSTDASASVGGLVEPFSPEDPAYEESIRQAADSLQPGQIGPIVPIRNGFAAVYLVGRIPPDGITLAQARDDLAEQLRRRQERLAMDQLATQLLAEANVKVFDESLNWSVRAGQQR